MRTYRGMFISDIHMNNRLPFARGHREGESDRLLDQRGLWRRFGASAAEFKADAAFVLGDLFDKALVDPITLTATVEEIVGLSKSLGIPFFIIGGNHDAINTRGGRFVVEAFGKMGASSIHYLETGSPISPSEWLTFWPMEYCEQERAAELVGQMALAAGEDRARRRKKRLPSTHVLLCHQSFRDCKFNEDIVEEDGLDPDAVCEGFDAVLSGHFHWHQTFGPDGRGMYLSAPMHHRFDDAGRDAGYWAMEFQEGGPIEKNFIDGGCPRFHELEWPSKRTKKARPGDYLKIKVRATSAEWELAKDEVNKAIAELEAEGFRAIPKHVPIYHHSTRLAKSARLEDAADARPEKLLDAYLEAPEVDTSGLDMARLSSIGHRALAAGRAKVGA